MPNNKRAIQFMPFNGLRGYDALVYAAEHPKEMRREITEARAARLDEIMSRLRKGDLVRVTFYTGSGYEELACRVKEIDTAFRVLRTDKGAIAFCDLWEVIRGDKDAYRESEE